MRNIKANISVGFSETQEPVMENNSVERMDDGSFTLILDSQNAFNIDHLENALLQTSYPALLAVLFEHLEQAVPTSRKRLPRFVQSGRLKTKTIIH